MSTSNITTPRFAEIYPNIVLVGEFEAAINRATYYVNRVNTDHGWFDNDRSFGDDIALLHSEVSEMLESYRKSGLSTVDSTDKDSIPAEAADILIRLLDMCHRYNIDLATAFFDTMARNESRPLRHGNKVL